MHLLRKRSLRWLAVWLAGALLCAQLAVAGYACPALKLPVAPPVAMPDCHHAAAQAMDPVQPQLCQAHCQQGSQAADASAPQLPATAPLLLAVLDWQDALAPAPQLALARERFFEAGAPPPGAPPLYLSLLVLRR